jgi:hypothetical protein
MWPALPVKHVLDVALLPVFMRSHRDALSSGSEVPLSTLHVARVRQVLSILLATMIVAMIGASLLNKNEGLGVWFLLALSWGAPTLFPLTWLLGAMMWGRLRTAVFVVALLVPWLNLVLLFIIWRRARRYMEDKGLAKVIGG